MIEGAAILLVGILVGRILPGRRRPRNDLPVKAICGCKHSIGYHKNFTGHCNGTVGIDKIPCTCQHYDGPKPIESFFATPLLPPGDS